MNQLANPLGLGLKKKLSSMEKNGKLYEWLVRGSPKPFRYVIHLPVVSDMSQFRSVLLNSIEYWNSFSSMVGCTVEYGRPRQQLVSGFQFARSVPKTLVITDPVAVFSLLGLQERMKQFLFAYSKVVVRYPCLSSLLVGFKDLLLDKDIGPSAILSLSDYLSGEPVTGCYIKEWQVPGIDTKFYDHHFLFLRSLVNVLYRDKHGFVELQDRDAFFSYFKLIRNYPSVSVGFLDPRMYFNGIDRVQVRVDKLNQLMVRPSVVFVFENENNGDIVLDRIFPAACNCAVFYGMGKSVSSLKDVSWLQNCKIYYSGDFDYRGYEMLSDLRKIFPQTVSILMDPATLQCFKGLKKKFSGTVGDLDTLLLTDWERESLDMVLAGDIRLEQEKFSGLMVDTVKGLLSV